MADIYVNSWDEFVEAVKTRNSTVICPEGAEWDMNNIAPTGLDKVTTIASGVKVCGNGTTVKNVYCDYFLNGGTVYKMNFLDMYIENSATSWYYQGAFSGTAFYECKFSGYLTKGQLFRACRLYTDEKGCSVNFDMAEDSGLATDSTFQNSVIRLSGRCITSEGYQPQFDNCLITGSAKSLKFKGKYSVFDLTADSLSGASSNTTLMLVNSDKCSSAEYCTLVSGEQLRNAEYLKGIGFPIGVDRCGT